MNKISTALAGILALAHGIAFAQEDPKARVKAFQALRERTIELHAEVAKAPDDRKLHQRLLKEGLLLDEFVRRSSHTEVSRTETVQLKQVINDMLSIQKITSRTGLPMGLTGEQFAESLKTKKVPYGNRRAAPLVDPWGTPYRFFVYPENGQFKIVSAGRGKKFNKENFGLTEKELRNTPRIKNKSLDENIVFIDGQNFTRIYDYPEDVQTFLFTMCEPADEPNPERHRCW